MKKLLLLIISIVFLNGCAAVQLAYMGVSAGASTMELSQTDKALLKKYPKCDIDSIKFGSLSDKEKVCIKKKQEEEEKSRLAILEKEKKEKIARQKAWEKRQKQEKAKKEKEQKELAKKVEKNQRALEKYLNSSKGKLDIEICKRLLLNHYVEYKLNSVIPTTKELLTCTATVRVSLYNGNTEMRGIIIRYNKLNDLMQVEY